MAAMAEENPTSRIRGIGAPPGRRASWESLLRCPSCRAEDLHRRGRQLECRACGRSHPERAGYVDLLVGSARGEPPPTTAEQRLMESELIARVYERFWRPAFVRLLAGSGASGATGGFPGEFFIHKNALGLDDRGGPWLDISRAMLETAARRMHGYGNVCLVRADAHDLPFTSECFAGVNNAGALHVYDDPEAVFREVIRVLEPGGIYVGSTFAQSRSPLSRLTARVAGIRRFDPPELRAWLSRIGFADYEEIRPGDALIFRVRKP